MFLSSYSIVFILVWLNNLKKFSFKEILNTFNQNRIFWVICAVIFVLSNIFLGLWIYLVKKDASTSTRLYNFEHIENKDSEVLNYFITYLIPIVSLKVCSLPSIVMNLIVILIIGTNFIKNNTLHFNPTLILFGYHVYSDKNRNIILSKKSIDEIINEDLKGDQVGCGSRIFFIP